MPILVLIHPVVWALNPNKQTKNPINRHLDLFFLHLDTRKYFMLHHLLDRECCWLSGAGPSSSQKCRFNYYVFGPLALFLPLLDYLRNSCWFYLLKKREKLPNLLLHDLDPLLLCLHPPYKDLIDALELLNFCKEGLVGVL